MGFFSRPDGEWLSRRFGPRIEIHIDDDRVLFRSGAREVVLAPRMYVRNQRIVAFGVRPAQDPVEEIDVFSGSIEGVQPADLLAWFLSHGIMHVLQRSFTIRPQATLFVGGTRCPPTLAIEAVQRAGVRNPTIA
jgi:hypothetical protein